MSTLCLTLRVHPAQRVDLSPLSADKLAGKSPAEIAAVELATGNRRDRVDSLFTVSGGFASEIEIRNSCDRLDRIGAGMSRGRVVVHGDAGSYAGADMQGGSIEIHGNTGAFAATGMSGGTLRITGNTGDFLGAAIPGEHQGMKGGTVIVGGDAGERAGDRMRRGTILIDGNAGDYCASRMVAGTIAVWGRVGRSPGLAMRRGTLILQQPPERLLPTFNDCGDYPLTILTLLARSWRGLPGKAGMVPDRDCRVRRFTGDLANGGQGEVLVRVQQA